MSIFDKDLIEKNISLRKNPQSEMQDVISETFAKANRGFKEEPEDQLNASELKCLVSAMAFTFEKGEENAYIGGFIWYRHLQDDLKIEISDKEPTYKEKRREGGDTLVLGEFIPVTKTIVLYIKNIRKTTKGTEVSSASLLVNVFAHEMYHAYFQERNIGGEYALIPEVEEPLAEYGALLFTCAFLENNHEFEGILEFVRKKNDMLPHYALGAALFDNNEAPDLIIKYLVISKDSFHEEQLKEYKNTLSQGGNIEAIKKLKDFLYKR